MADTPPESSVRELLGPWARADPSRVSAIRDFGRDRAASSLCLNLLGDRIEPSSLPFITGSVPWASDGAYFVARNARPGGHLLYGTGAYYIQEPSSLLAAAVLDPQPGEVICDLCAAPGGKSTAILNGLGERGFLLANESVRSRVAPLRLNLARHGGWRYTVTNLDPESLALLLPGAFDAVLVDAPCSGQSMVFRGKQSVSAFEADSVRVNAARQRRILRAAAALLKPGGRLVYSTCTYSWAENEQHVVDLLSSVPCAWHPDPVDRLEPYGAGGPAPPACYRLWPDRHGCAGAFAARLRYAPAESAPVAPGSHARRAKRGRRFDARQVPLTDWGTFKKEFPLLGDDRRCYSPADGAPSWAGSVGRLPEVAYRKGKSWFPAYGLAMRRDDAFAPACRQALGPTDAAAYLAGHPCPSDLTGWCVCTFDGLSLGWGKATAGTLKNHLPMSARLRIDSQNGNPDSMEPADPGDR